MKKILIFLTLTILLSFSVFADTFPYNLFSGSITLSDGTTTINVPVGAVLSATIGGSDAGSYTIESAGWFAMAVTPPSRTDGATITFAVTTTGWSVSSCTSSTYSFAKENGDVRWLNLACTGTISTTASTADNSAGSGGGGGTSEGAAVVTVPTQITDPTTIANIISWINPAELGLSSLSSDSVSVTELRESTDNTQISVGDLGTLINEMTNPLATETLNELQTLLESGEAQNLEVSKTLNVYEIKSKETNEIVTRSLFAVTITAESASTDIKVIEVIPKSVAKQISDIIFLGEQPEILQDGDPIVVQWTIPSMDAGLSKTFEYVVKNEVFGIESQTLSAGMLKEEKLVSELPPAKPIYGWIIAFGIIIAGLVWYFSRKK